MYAALRRAKDRDYRARFAKACWAHTARTAGVAAVIMYDVTTLHFEADDEDDLRKVGMSKERRVDPQVKVGLLVDPTGFPLEVHLFEGNKAETKTLIPVLTAFHERHDIDAMVVVADAGMLSAANLNAMEDAGFSFIVGSRLSRPPTTWPTTSNATGTTSPTGRSSSRPAPWAPARPPANGGWSTSARSRGTSTTTGRSTPMIAKAEKVAAGTTPMARTGSSKSRRQQGLDWALVDRARQLAGLKGYVTNLPTRPWTGSR